VTTAPLVTVIICDSAAVVTAAAMTLVCRNLPGLIPMRGTRPAWLNGDYLQLFLPADGNTGRSVSRSDQTGDNQHSRAGSPQRYRGLKQPWPRMRTVAHLDGSGDDKSQHLLSFWPSRPRQPICRRSPRPVDVTAADSFLTDITIPFWEPDRRQTQNQKSCRFCVLTEALSPPSLVTVDDNSRAHSERVKEHFLTRHDEERCALSTFLLGAPPWPFSSS